MELDLLGLGCGCSCSNNYEFHSEKVDQWNVLKSPMLHGFPQNHWETSGGMALSGHHLIFHMSVERLMIVTWVSTQNWETSKVITGYCHYMTNHMSVNGQ